MSQSSAIEVKSMSYVLEDASLLGEEEAKELRKKAEETKAMTLGLIRYLRRRGPST
jgi:four helix bundle protein